MKYATHVLKQGLSVAALCLIFSGGTMAETVVIAGANSDVSSLSSAEVKKIYLGKNKSVHAVDQSKGSELRQDFLSKVVGKSEGQFKAYWSKKIFSGKGIPPKILANSYAVKSKVSSSAGTIGYIDSKDVDATVKVVYTVK